MMKATVFLALIASAKACCGLSFTTCCQAYAPPRIIGYERIPLYAKVPVQQPLPPPPAYPVAPAAPVIQEPVPSYPQPVVQQPIMMQQPTYFAQQPQTVVVQEPRTVVQPVVMQETPSYVPQAPTVVVQEYSAPRIPMAPVAAVAIAQPAYAQPGLTVGQPSFGVAQPANSLPTVIETNGADFNGGGAPLQVPTARALKLRRSYLKQVKAL